jgi:hypothetical protein
MAGDDLDRILAKEPEIVPSAGFARSVMDAVQSEAAAPPALAFPWKRALPGIAGAAVALGWAIVLLVKLVGGAAAAQPGPVGIPPAIALVVESAKTTGAGWIALALVLSFISVKLSSRLAA